MTGPRLTGRFVELRSWRAPIDEDLAAIVLRLMGFATPEHRMFLCEDAPLIQVVDAGGNVVKVLNTTELVDVPGLSAYFGGLS